MHMSTLLCTLPGDQKDELDHGKKNSKRLLNWGVNAASLGVEVTKMASSGLP